MLPRPFLKVRIAPRRRHRPPRRFPPSAWAAPQGDPAAVEVSDEDWRSQLHPETRQRKFNKIMETLKKHLPVSFPESELKNFAIRFEGDIYTAAINQSDYLRKISVKIMKTETQTTTAANPSSSNPVVGNLNPADSAQTGHAGVVDWQEETYQKVKSLKELYLPELIETHERICMKLPMLEEALPSPMVDRLRKFKQIIEFCIAVLQTSKNIISENMRDWLPLFEKKLLSLLNANKNRKVAHSQLPGDQHFQNSGGPAHSMTQQQTQPPLQQLDSATNDY